MSDNEVLNAKIRKTLIKIDVLDWNTERKINSLEGSVISGSLTIDGSSSVRRTANLTVSLDDNNYKLTDLQNILSLNKKIAITIGVQDLSKVNKLEYSYIDSLVPSNLLYPSDNLYPDSGRVLWKRVTNSDNIRNYKLGIFIITKPTVTVSTSSNQVALVLQDKGCLLNGIVSGVVKNPIRLDVENLDLSEENSVSEFINTVSPMMRDIKYTNKDETIPALIAEVKKSMYSNFGMTNTSEIFNLITELTVAQRQTSQGEFDAKMKTAKVTLSSIISAISVRKLKISEIIKYAVSSIGGEAPGKIIIEDIPDKIKCPVKIPKGTYKFLDGTTREITEDQIGYKMIDYVYPDTLTAQGGGTVTSILDSCNSALGGNYEYYYDVNGYFHFREIRNYRYNRTPSLEEITSSDYRRNYNQSAVVFDFSNDSISTSFNNVLDFTNIKNDITVGNTYNGQYIGYHIVIDKKPTTIGYVYDGAQAENMDYRELIVHNYNTGTYTFTCRTDTTDNLKKFMKLFSLSFGQNVTGYIGYVSDDSTPGYYLCKEQDGEWTTEYIDVSTITRSLILPDYYEDAAYWVETNYDKQFRLLGEDVEKFYNFEILDADSELKKFSVSSIGRRQYAKTDSSIKSLMPTIISDYFVATDAVKDDYNKYWYNASYTIDARSDEEETSYEKELKFPLYGNIYNDAFTTIKQLLFNKTQYNDTVTIVSLPYYYLEPNNRVKAYYPKASINGFFLLNKITFNFDANGLMTSNLTRADSLEENTIFQ